MKVDFNEFYWFYIDDTHFFLTSNIYLLIIDSLTEFLYFNNNKNNKIVLFYDIYYFQISFV